MYIYVFVCVCIYVYVCLALSRGRHKEGKKQKNKGKGARARKDNALKAQKGLRPQAARLELIYIYAHTYIHCENHLYSSCG